MTDLRPEDLPAWMRPRSRINDRGWLIVLGFSVLLILPLLTRPGLPAGTAADLYAYRSLEVKRLLQSGTLYSRWAPDFNYTFGSPAFNYLAPLPHYLAGLHQDITEADPVSSIRLLIGLSILAAGTGMYLFVHGRWGSHAALIAALVYAFSPPLAVTLPYQTGELGPLLALAVLPWTLWALDRLWHELDRNHLWLAVIFLTLFILSDNRIAPLALPIIVVAMISLRRRTWPQRRAYRYVLIAMISSAALSAFFWLPALAERDAVHWLPLTPDPNASPVTISEILGQMPRGIGVGTWLLVLLGIVGVIVQMRRGKRPFGVTGFFLVGLIFLVAATPAFAGLWTSDFQTPWAYHALLLAVFCLAIVAGQSASLLNRLPCRWQTIALVALALVGPLTMLPTIYPPQWTPHAAPLDDLSLTQAELQHEQIGTFRDGILLPATAPQLPEPPNDLLDQLKLGTFQHMNAAQYAANTHISSLEQGLLRSHFIIDATQPVITQFNALYFPGWTASLNGQTQVIQPSSNGLITLPVPQASSDVMFSFEGTGLRTAAWAISLMGVILVIVASRRLRRPISQNTLASIFSPESTQKLSRRELVGLAIALFLYAIVVLTIYAKSDLLLAAR